MYCKINKEKNLNKELKKISLLRCIKMCKCLFIHTDWENQLGIQITDRMEFKYPRFCTRCVLGNPNKP